MNSLHTMAIVFIVAFLAFLVFIGIWAARKNTQGAGSATTEYFLGGKTTPTFVLAMSYAASAVSAGSFIGDPGLLSTIGWPYYWIAIATVAGTAIPGLLIIRKMRLQSEKFGSITIADYCSQRYKSPGLKLYLSILMVICFTFTLVAQFKGAAILLEMYTGIPFKAALVVMLVVVIFFVSSGGLRSVAWTDCFMGCFMTVMSAMLVIVAISYVGGFGRIEEILAGDYPSFNQIYESGSEAEVTVTAFGIPMLFLYGVFIMFCQPYITARYIALPNVKKSSIGKFLIIAILTAALFNLMFLVGRFPGCGSGLHDGNGIHGIIPADSGMRDHDRILLSDRIHGDVDSAGCCTGCWRRYLRQAFQECDAEKGSACNESGSNRNRTDRARIQHG